jgi:selenocysteine-specific elongation factor
VKNRSRVRLHVGTAELLANVRLLDRERLECGESAPAQLFLSEPAVTTWQQPLVLRSESPVVTIGGGTVLVPTAQRIRRVDKTTLEQVANLRSDEETVRASAALYFAGLQDWQPSDLSRTAGIEDVQGAHQALVRSGDLREIAISPTRTMRVHRLVISQLCDRLAASLETLHKQHPLKPGFDRARFLSGFSYLGDSALLDAVLDEMQQAGRVKLTERSVALAGQGPKLSQNEQKLLGQLVQMFRDAGLKPPTVKECQAAVAKNRDAVPQLVDLAAASGDLVKVAQDFYLHCDVEQQARQSLAQELAASDGLTLSQIRELLETTRKYAVPLCEYFDEIGFTQRLGDLRVLGSAARSSCASSRQLKPE